MQAQALKPFSPKPRSAQRAFGGTMVIALHVGLVIALLYGLKVAVTPVHDKPIVVPPIIIEKPVNPPPQPPTPHQQTTEVYVPPPDNWTDESQQPTNDTGGIQATYTPHPQAAMSAPAQSIMSTHTIPPYPPIAIRLGEQGNVTLQVHISENGAVTDAVVLRTSGHPRLDEAAVAWVKAHWRYRPAEQAGKPVASTMSAVVKFELRNAR